MTQINAYLRFGGNCREAMTFYKECLSGELTMQTVGESPIASQMPPASHKGIMHATLKKDGLVLLGSDMVGPEGVVKGNAIVLLLDCSSAEEIKTYFARLSAGGQVTYPLKTEFWGATFGQLTDKFGVDWMLNYDKNANP
jgi:PhnB protein